MNKLKNYWIYFFICIISLVVRICPLTVGSNYLNVAINDIALGAFSSSLVAGLIFWNDYKNTEKENEYYRAIIVNEFFYEIMQYMDQICFSCVYYKKDERSIRKTFLEWNEYYYKQGSMQEKGELKDYTFAPLNKEYMDNFIDRLTNHYNKINNDKVFFLRKHLLSEDDLYEINSIYTTIVANYNVLACCTEKEISSNIIYSINKDLNQIIADSKFITDIKNIRYSFDIKLKEFYKKL